MVSESEFSTIVLKCRMLPPARGVYLENDYITNLFLTVLDFQMHGRAVENAISHYKDKRWNEIRMIEHLDNLLSRFPDDKDGNTEIARHLWGNKHWTRVSLLRKLVAYFQSVGIISQDALTKWAKTSDYERDFKGRIPRMGFAIYKWLIMRQGVETVKPDVHLRRFVQSVIHRALSDFELVKVLEKVAQELGIKAYQLDSNIWEYQRSVTGAGRPKVP